MSRAFERNRLALAVGCGLKAHSCPAKIESGSKSPPNSLTLLGRLSLSHGQWFSTPSGSSPTTRPFPSDEPAARALLWYCLRDRRGSQKCWTRLSSPFGRKAVCSHSTTDQNLFDRVVTGGLQPEEVDAVSDPGRVPLGRVLPALHGTVGESRDHSAGYVVDRQPNELRSRQVVVDAHRTPGWIGHEVPHRKDRQGRCLGFLDAGGGGVELHDVLIGQVSGIERDIIDLAVEILGSSWKVASDSQRPRIRRNGQRHRLGADRSAVEEE